MDLRALPDPFWIAAAVSLENLYRPGDLLLAPPDFLAVFAGTIAHHVRKRMLAGEIVSHYLVHKGMLDRMDPEFLREAAAATPIFANAIFVVFSQRGALLPADQHHHLTSFNDYMATLAPKPVQRDETGIVVTTYNRPWALKRTLASLARQRFPILVIDDGSSGLHRFRNRAITHARGATYVRYPFNLGLANAINIGVGHWLAHPTIEWISVFNDDVEIADRLFGRLSDVSREIPYPQASTLYTGYSDHHHPLIDATLIAGETVQIKRSCSGRHLHAHRSYWQRVLPVPTVYRGAPKRRGGYFPGQGSDGDWWISCWSPQSALKRDGRIVALPDLVTTFASPGESTWSDGK